MAYEAMIEWVASNYDYGHLDDLPDALLSELLFDRLKSEKFAWALFKRSSPPKPVAASVRVRKWLVIERLRRMGKLWLLDDVLVKELACIDPRGLVTPENEPFVGEIVEVSPGKVMIVGEEISLTS